MIFNHISDHLTALEHPYPSSNQLKKALSDLLFKEDEESLEEFMKLWLTEGVPYVFKDIPILYERVRTLLVKELNIDFRKVFMIGSGKLGLSLDPKKFTSPFRYPESDLDFTIIDEKLLKKMEGDFWKWKEDYQKEISIPKNKKEEKFWKYNVDKVPNNIERGFIDVYKIPARSRYKTRYKFTEIIPLIRRLILKYTKQYFSDKGITFRIYKNWESFFNQNMLNIKNLKEIFHDKLQEN